MSRIMIYKRFERFWHWFQALLIFTLLFTGFEIHGSYSVIGFGEAARLHTLAAWALIVLWLFVIFWHTLQRLAYLFFKLMITPVIWLTGLLYLFYNDWPATLTGALELETVALVHTGAAFAMLIFIIAHVYMATMGPKLTSLIKPMVTGYEDLD